MTASWCLTGNPAVAHANASTYYQPFCGHLGTQTSDESLAEIPVRHAGVFSKAFALVTVNTAGNAATVTLRKSRANTSLVVTITAGATGIFEDTSNTATFAATDKADYAVTVPSEAGSTAVTITLIGCQFTPDTAANTVSWLVWGNGSTAVTLSTASSSSFYGTKQAVNGTEARLKLRVNAAVTSSNLYAMVHSNARSTSTTIRTRKNGANGSQSITVGSGASGAFEDTVNTDSIASGDDVNFSITLGTGSGNFLIGLLAQQVYSTAGYGLLPSQDSGGETVNFNTTSYMALGASLNAFAAETNMAAYPRFDLTLSQLSVYLHANTIATSATTFTVRNNGADSALTVSFAAGATGWALDSTNLAALTSGTDKVATKVVTPNTSGTIDVRTISVIGTPTVGVRGMPFGRRGTAFGGGRTLTGVAR